MYTEINFKTKKAMKEALANGKEIFVYQPGGLFPGATDRTVSIEGPHYPAVHSWYARVVIKDGKVTRVLS